MPKRKQKIPKRKKPPRTTRPGQPDKPKGETPEQARARMMRMADARLAEQDEPRGRDG